MFSHASAPADAPTTTWRIDPAHTHIEFAVRHMMIATVKGRFSGVDGTLTLDERDPARSRVEVDLDAATIDTRNADRDAHLRSPDFFDVETYPRLTFRSDRVEVLGTDGRLRVGGDLTIRGVTRPTVLEVRELGRNTSPYGEEVIAFEAETTIDRREFGLKWNQALETGGVLVGNEVRIHLEIEAVRQSA